ncbi:hexose kinase [candidate division GN15 bacterium]|nr:hexose kinase [candidate division GN15 bacterium]
MAIVTLTMNPTVDMSTVAKRLLPDRKLRCEKPLLEPGGGGINVTRAVGKLGGEALALFPAGGTNGDLLTQMLDREGVESRAIDIDGMTRQNLTVREEAEDHQYRFVMPGPELSEAEWSRCLRTIEKLDPPPAYVVASGSLPPGVPDDFYARLADRTRDAGIRLIMDTSGEPLRRVVDRGVFLIKPNVREITDLMDVESQDETAIEQAAEAMIEQCDCEYVVVSLGAAGALLISDAGTSHVRSPTVPIRSKVGAGDSMVAGIALALERGEDITDATRFGVAAGASAVMTPGTELCRRETTEELMKNI